MGQPTLSIVLPIGISFFTFQAISYVIDIGRGVWTRPVPLLDFAVYLTFFAHLVAGPIVRASEFIPQLDTQPDPRYVRSSEAFMLIFRGLFKKVVISSYMATVADPVFNLPAQHSRWAVLWGIWAYAIQIYADFSGYTDIAIGIALLLGIRFPQNFDAPYRSLSFQEFWRRWHMTLSRWLRDYLYIPLGGNRGSDGFMYRNLMLTMVIGGLWHGANWTFVIWGIIQGVALVAERVIKKRAGPAGPTPMGLPTWLVHVLQWVVTFQVICLAWVFFRAPNFSDAMAVLGRLFQGGGSSTPGHPAADVHHRGHAGVPVRPAPGARAGHRGVRAPGPRAAAGRPGGRPGAGRRARAGRHRPVHLLPVLNAEVPLSSPGAP